MVEHVEAGSRPVDRGAAGRHTRPITGDLSVRRRPTARQDRVAHARARLAGDHLRGIHRADHPVGELSCWLLPEARGRSLASAAVKAMALRARETTDLRSLAMDIEIDNIASVRVAERVGAKRRDPPRIELDRAGVPRTMVVFVLSIA
ncbi:MAG: GNAT family N-acetyltransferase [Solirubrobacteraceae bacterium]